MRNPRILLLTLVGLAVLIGAGPPVAQPAGRPLDGASHARTDDSGRPVLHDVRFDTGQLAIPPASASVLRQNAMALRAHPTRHVLLEGHADERGAIDYSLVLGERRAATVRRTLVAMGLDAARLSVSTKGKEAPVCLAHTPACWQQNRRVRFILQP